MIIQATELSKVYGEGENRVVALDRASLAIAPGDLISIMGPSGSGKSTLLHLLPVLTARENIIMPLLLDKKQPDQGYLEELAGMLGIGERLGHLPHELSGGQQQRVAIARALIAKPDVIFADEPTGNLDSRSGSEVMELLKQVGKELGKALVVITHDSRVAGMAARRLVMVDGVLTEVTAG